MPFRFLCLILWASNSSSQLKSSVTLISRWTGYSTFLVRRVSRQRPPSPLMPVARRGRRDDGGGGLGGRRDGRRPDARSGQVMCARVRIVQHVWGEERGGGGGGNPGTEGKIKVCTWLREISSCSCLTVCLALLGSCLTRFAYFFRGPCMIPGEPYPSDFP